ncbi:MAG: chemotaxis protein CheA [Amphritea sp.]|nr:chemotaxis protein CheA [Amphritea sp.]
MSLDTSEFLDALMEESFEALDAMEVSLLELDHGGDDAELINTIFRGAHSIKGGCGMLGLDEIASFTHVIETLLDKVRDGEIAVDMPLTGLLLECVDAVRGMFDALSNDESSDRVLIDSLIARLNAALEGRTDDVLPTASAPQEAAVAPAAPKVADSQPEPEPAVESQTVPSAIPDAAVANSPKDWIIQMTPPGNLIDSAADMAEQFSQLEQLGDAVVLGQTSQLPELNQIDPTHCYLSWAVNLTSAQTFEDIRDVMAAVFPQWQIEIHAEPTGQMKAEDNREFSQLMDVLRGEQATDPSEKQLSEPAVVVSETEAVSVMPAVEQPETPVEVDQVQQETPAEPVVGVVEVSSVAEPQPVAVATESESKAETVDEVAVQPPAQPSPQPPTQPKAEVKTEKAKAKEKPKAKAKGPAKDRKQADTGSIRVSTQKIDTLINMAGELVITQAMLTQQGEKLMESGLGNLENLWDGLGQLERNLRELQDAVMSIRMLPISFAFSRFPRMIRDLNARIGKDVRLETSGEQTELDKTVMEKIGDPLVHLVRNSFDHGIELPEDRRAAGKPEQGVIELNAYHQGGNIIIEVVDDGKGLDRDKIVAKARERGLLGPEEEIADDKALELIFEPGFSTVEQVSDLSGRGVGMDVVRRNIRELGGNIELHSEVGVGTKFTIRLPLTLAILDGQLVYVGGETFVIPLLSIIESIQIDKRLLSTVAGSRQLYQLRDEYIPVVSLYELFGLSRTDETVDHDLLVVIEGDGKKIGLRVDDLLGQQQAFIKSLETNYKQVPGVSGATILGDGTVSLILDAGAIVRLSGCAD